MINLLAAALFSVIGAAVVTFVFWIWQRREGPWWKRYNISDEEMERFSKEEDS